MSDARTVRPAWWTLSCIALAPILVHLDLSTVAVGFPLIERTFSATARADLSWVLNGFTIVFAALLVAAGQFADTFGRRRALMLGLWLFLAGAAACALAPSVPMLVAARALQAIGAALVVPSSLGLMISALPATHRGRATGAWSAAAAVGGAVGFLSSGVLGSLAGWRGMLWAEVPIAVIALVAASLVSVPDEQRRRAKPDGLGALLLGLSVGAAALAIVRAPSEGLTSPYVVAAFGGAAVFLWGFVSHCGRRLHPVLELSLFRVPSFAAGTLGVLCFASAFYALQLVYSLYLLGLWGVTPLAAGLMLAPGPLVAVATAMASGRLVDRIGPAPVALAGTSAFAVGCMALAIGVGPNPDFATRFLPGLLLVNAGIGLSFTSLTAMGVSALPPARLSTGVAMISSIRQLGGVIGVAALLGALQTTDVSKNLAAFHFVDAAMAIASLLAGATAVTLYHRHRTLAPSIGRIPVPAPSPRPVPAQERDRVPASTS